ncbi:hypothetical protein EDD11_010264 [Mortierella claussenii]|nr:hypothetical protein EDD11_010264 [Mortierella claussenii]
MVHDALIDAQKIMKDQYDKHLQQIDFDVGDLVNLEGEHIRSTTDSNIVKFLPRFRGPYKILAKPNAYSLIKTAVYTTSSPLINKDGSYYRDEYEVKHILKHKKPKDGYLHSENTW